MTATYDRRRILLCAAAASLASTRAHGFDGKSVMIGGAEYALTDILAPSTLQPEGSNRSAADFAVAAIAEILKHGAVVATPGASIDRWGRISGPIRWRTHDGRDTTLQEILLAQGAARVAPEGADFDFIEQCYAAEQTARESRLGVWASGRWRIRDAGKAEWSRGYQVYKGRIMKAGERDNRIYFNFGADFRNDFTASVLKRVFRKWRGKPRPEDLTGADVEVRGLVLSINGPSIELTHEMQLRRTEKAPA